jgi:hypothetical protein
MDHNLGVFQTPTTTRAHPLPKRTAMTEMITLWCNLKGDSSLFKVEIAPEQTVADLKDLIHAQAVGNGLLPLAKDLVLWKVRHPHWYSLYT